MKINVLQGINLKRDSTTIEITFDQKLDEKAESLFKKISEIHELFGIFNKLSESQIEIISELPHLWKEIAKKINAYLINNSDFSTTEDYIYKTIIKLHINSMSTIPVLYEAVKEDYEITRFFLKEGTYEGPGNVNNRYYVIGKGCHSEITCSISSSKDTYLAEKVQRDKWLTNTVIERLNLPIPKWELIHGKEAITEIFEKYEKPFVIKPTGLTGGHGVTTNIKTIEQAYKAYEMAEKAIEIKPRSPWQNKIMAQEQVKSVSNEDYRLLVINGKLEVATKRIPALVTGNGVSNIRELIEETNKDPRRDIKNPTHILKPIKIDEMLLLYLEEKGISLEYIPQKDETVYVRKTSSMSQGGITEDVTEKVNPQIKNIVETIANSIHAYVMGADIMCVDITKPLSKENGAILEVNTMPESYLNLYPVIGPNRDYVIKTYLDGLLKDKPKCETVVILDEKNEIKSCSDLKKYFSEDGKKTGTLLNNQIYIDEQFINVIPTILSAIESLKINCSLERIVVVYKSIAEIEKNGLGFNYIDKFICSSTKISEKLKNSSKIKEIINS